MTDLLLLEMTGCREGFHQAVQMATEMSWICDHDVQMWMQMHHNNEQGADHLEEHSKERIWGSDIAATSLRTWSSWRSTTASGKNIILVYQ